MKVFKKINKYINKLTEGKLVFQKSPVKNTEFLGTEYGGWVIPSNYLDNTSICYCAGAGEDISFDVELVNKYQCNVFIFDPTQRAIDHFENFKKNTLEGKSTFINNNPTNSYSTEKKLFDYLNFYNFGLWNEDTTIKFFAPENEKDVSHSALNLQHTDHYFEAKVKRVSSIMKELNHQKIDLLKIDIEGAEYNVIEDLIASNIKVNALCIEFDESSSSNIDSNYIKRIQKSLDLLQEAGFLVIFEDTSFNFTLVHKDVYQQLIT